MNILSIDTSCDETSVAVLRDLKVLSSIISSQVDLHRKWGGVVPDIARRAHKENIEICYKEALKRARLKINEIDRISVTYGPGLAIALEVGIDFAKNISLKNNIPLVAINHIESHLFSSLLENKVGKRKCCNQFYIKELFPALGIVLSGSHTDLIYIEKIGKYKIIGQTLDDAIGEAFDKVARMLNLGYPGGEIITHLAQNYRKSKNKIPKEIIELIKLPVPMEKSGDYNFSYSGLKTSCLYKINEIRQKYPIVEESLWAPYFCHKFIDVVARSVYIKAKKALENYPQVRSMLIGGGVVNNKYITRSLSSLSSEFSKNFLYPEKRHRGDNASMIGGLAFLRQDQPIKNLDDLDRKPSLQI